MIHFYYGNGKGKTTAAMGLAVRALGRGMRVCIVQFLKNTPSGEALFWRGMQGVEHYYGKAGKGLTFRMTEEEKRETAAIHNENLRRGTEAVERGACDLLILDEAGDALSLSLLDEQALLTFLRDNRDRAEIVITGHGPVGPLMDMADYVTEMQKHKHPYDQGVRARKGIEV